MFSRYTHIAILGPSRLAFWIKKALQVQIRSRFYRRFFLIMSQDSCVIKHILELMGKYGMCMLMLSV